MRDVIEQFMRAISTARSRSREKTPRMPRSLRPHGARSTFRPVTDVEVIRRMVI